MEAEAEDPKASEMTSLAPEDDSKLGADSYGSVDRVRSSVLVAGDDGASFRKGPGRRPESPIEAIASELRRHGGRRSTSRGTRLKGGLLKRASPWSGPPEKIA